jgi:hypothetical protein
LSITTDVSWADLVQTGLSLLAFFAVPAAASKLWDTLRYSFRATSTPIEIDPDTGGADTWQIEISNRAHNRASDLNCTIMPADAGSNIVFARVQTEEDGGLHIPKAVLESGAFNLEVARIAPRRSIYMILRMTRPGRLHVQAQGKALRHVVRERRFGFVVSISRLRMIILSLYFTLGFAVILVRLVVLGLSK